MKTAFLFLAGLLLSLATYSQTDSQVWNAFSSKFQSLEDNYRKYYAAKDYVQTEASLQEMIVSVDNLKLSEQEKKDFQSNLKMMRANIYYNLACTRALLHQKKQAINDFEKAIEWGYTEYQHAKTDSDLDNIRGDKKFIALMGRIKQFDMLHLLQQSGNYQRENKDSLPVFQYQKAGNHNLKRGENVL